MSLVSDLRLLINEPASNPVKFWTDQQVYDALNQAVLETILDIKPYLTSTSISVSSEIVALPSGIVIPQSVEYNNEELFRTTDIRLEQHSRTWKSATPTRPTHFVVTDFDSIRFWPRPNQTYTMTVYGVGWPAEITGGNQDWTGIDNLLRYAIIHRAASQLFEHTQPDLADVFLGESESYIEKYKSQIRNSQGSRIQHLRPLAKGWEVAQLGNVRVGRRFRP